MKFINEINARKEMKLSYLGTINSSSKLIKNKKVSNNYTYVIYSAPSNMSGYNVCSHSTPECRLGCLNTSGRAGIELLSNINTTTNARIKKSKLFFENQEYYMNWVVAEMKRFQKKAIKDNYDFSARLNCTSDIDWAKVKLNGKNIFEIFPEVQFYDYTKNSKIIEHNIPNYHITFSYTGKNEKTAFHLLNKGNNIAIVFDTKRDKPLPTMFKGYKVINGDLTDYRPNDDKGVIVGLRYKKIANKEVQNKILNSCFVVKENHINSQF